MRSAAHRSHYHKTIFAPNPARLKGWPRLAQPLRPGPRVRCVRQAVFANLSRSLTINASNDGEKISVNRLESGFTAPVNLQGKDGHDTFALGNDLLQVSGLRNPTVNSLAGVADLAAVRLNGMAGDDTFDVTPGEPGENVHDEVVALRRVRRAEMVRAFIVSQEYRRRLGTP